MHRFPGIQPGRTNRHVEMLVGVNSFDEWSPLREVIVGSGVGYTAHELETSFKLFYHDVARRAFRTPASDGVLLNDVRPVKQQYVDELNEDIEGLVEALRSLHVTVHRPLPLPDSIRFRTPAWDGTIIPALNVRDQTLVLGEEIIETPPLVRARYFESNLLKPVFYEYFRQGARWTVMPRPIMTDQSFDLSYVTDDGHVSADDIVDVRPSPFDVGYEMMLDAAQCIRFGRDVLINVSTANHAMAYEWLRRHTGTRFRYHEVYRLADNHLDSIVLPLRPGTLLVRSPEFVARLPESLQKWDVIFPPEPNNNAFPEYTSDDLVITSRFIDVNILSVSPDTVIVNSLYPELARTLESRGFTVVPVRHRHRRLFGGGFHCFTLDTVREGSAEDYLS